MIVIPVGNFGLVVIANHVTHINHYVRCGMAVPHDNADVLRFWTRNTRREMYVFLTRHKLSSGKIENFCYIHRANPPPVSIYFPLLVVVVLLLSFNSDFDR